MRDGEAANNDEPGDQVGCGGFFDTTGGAVCEGLLAVACPDVAAAGDTKPPETGADGTEGEDFEPAGAGADATTGADFAVAGVVTSNGSNEVTPAGAFVVAEKAKPDIKPTATTPAAIRILSMRSSLLVSKNAPTPN